MGYRRSLIAIGAAVALAFAGCSDAPPEHTPQQTPVAGPLAAEPAQVEVALRVLVLDDGSTMVGSLVGRLRQEGVPFERVPLAFEARDRVTRATLASRGDDGVVRAHFSGIIAPSLDVPVLSADERAALATYRDTFGVRTIRTSTRRLAPQGSKEVTVDGITATPTATALKDAFSYLRGTVPFDAPHGGPPTTATPVGRPAGAVAKTSYEPLLTADFPGMAAAVLLGVLRTDKHEEMLVNFDGDVDQTQIQVLSHGMLRWLNRTVSTSYNRNYFAVHSDDVLLPNAQWSVEGQCEVGRNCPPEVDQLRPVRMVAEDIDYLVTWQDERGIKIDLAINGSGAGLYAQDHGHRDPLTERLAYHTRELRLISHTWSHLFLGCVQILMPDDWRCVADDSGQPVWRSLREVHDEIEMNQAFMVKNRLQNYDPRELVTGEHSGLAKPPQQVVDNPHLATAFEQTGILWTAADTSTEFYPRPVGPAMTVPRYPIDLDYNTPTARQAASLYNWLHTSAADGGSGSCETDRDASCVTPIDLDTGYATTIVPEEAEKALHHIIRNDARPHFVHQTNQTGERLLYPVLDEALTRYRNVFADNSPLVNPTMSQAGTTLVNEQQWERSSGMIDASVAGRIVRITNRADSPVTVPLTVPEGSRAIVDGHLADVVGESYSNARSIWVRIDPGATFSYQLPESAGFATEATWTANGVG